MAGFADSNRDLWQLISNTSVPWPKDLIRIQLNRSKPKLTQGLDFYKKPSTPSRTQLSKEKKLPKLQLNFIEQLSNFLDLDELQCYELYRLYLVRDYRGSTKELLDVLNSERHRQLLLVKLRDFHYSERVYLLRCLSYMFSFSDPTYNHIYCDVFNECVRPLYETDDYVHMLVKQYVDISEQNLPSWNASGGTNMAEKQGGAWLVSNFQEQCDLLELLLIYYKRAEHKLVDLLHLLQHFKKQGFGRWQSNMRLMDETTELLLARIGFMQVLLVIDAMELESLTENMMESEFLLDRIANSSSFKDLDTLFMSLGDSEEHGPLLLMWAIVHQLCGNDGTDPQIARKLGNRAIQLKVFEYLNAQLATEPFSGKMIIAGVCRSVIYGLLSAALNTFRHQSLGDVKFLYHMASNLLDWEFIAAHFWSRDPTDGLMTLFHHAVEIFPMEFHLLIKLLTVLSKASRESATEVVNILLNLTSFTEMMARKMDCQLTDRSGVVVIKKDWRPYHFPGIQFVIKSGTLGSIFPVEGKCSSHFVHWELTYDGWEILAAEVHLLLNQISYGAGAIQQEAIHKTLVTCRLLSALLKVNHSLIQSEVKVLGLMIDNMYCIVQRYCLLPSSPPIDLLTACFEVFIENIQWEPLQVWHNMKQTGFLPHLSRTVTNLADASRALNSGACGSILAGIECVQGRYPVMQAFLQLLINLVEPLHSAGILDEMLPCLLFICQEIFPVIYKFRYHEPHAREQIGQKCLTVFGKILTAQSDISDHKATERTLMVRDVVVHSLLFAESSYALLDIIGMGVDIVEGALANQINALEGAGIELIALLKLAFSVMNQLLMSWPEGTSTSPVAQTLSSRPTNGTERHLVATVAHYIYHRHNPELPSNATLLLKNLALLFPMSMLSCLGNEAEAIRDIYLMRLQSATESIPLKVFTLEWLSICVQCQPGIIELFLNINLLKGKQDGEKEFGLGRDSCLQTVLDLIEVANQRTYRCPPELLCAASEFLHSLWKGRRQTAMTVLRSMKSFWTSVCHSLLKDLPMPGDTTDTKLMIVEITNCSHIFRILSLELYHSNRKVDAALEAEFNSIVSKDRLLYWSEYTSCLLAFSSSTTPSKELQQCTIQLLLAWREFIVVLSSDRVENVSLKASSDIGKGTTQDQILLDILNSLEIQFQGQNLTTLNMKLSSIASSLYLMVLKHWHRYISDYSATVRKIMEILAQTCACDQPRLSSVQTNLLASLILILQHTRSQIKRVDSSDLVALFPVVCELLQSCVRRLTFASSSDLKTTDQTSDSENKYGLLTTSVYLLKEMIASFGTDLSWLPVLKQCSTVQCLISTIIALLEKREGTSLIQASFLFFIDLCRIPEGAEVLLVNDINKQLCVLIGRLYSDPSATQGASTESKSSDFASSCVVYHQYISLMSAMLEILGSSFVKDALDFVGVHQERLHQCLECASSLLTDEILKEAEETCCFLARLAKHRCEWRLQMPVTLQILMSDVCTITQRSVCLLIQPRFLQFLLDKRVKCHEDDFNLTPTRQSVSRHLLQQSSLDDTEISSPELLKVQNRLLTIISQSLIAMRHFSPDLCNSIIDTMMDVSPYDPFVALGFNAPSIDQDSTPTFGTFIAIVNLCFKMLAKIDGKPAPSPLKPSTPKPVLSENCPVSRPVVMFLLEYALLLIMSQSMRYFRDTNLSQRDKQLLKRELSAELNSCLISLQRHLRCSTPTTRSSNPFWSEHSYFRVVDIFVKQILK